MTPLLRISVALGLLGYGAPYCRATSSRQASYEALLPHAFSFDTLFDDAVNTPQDIPPTESATAAAAIPLSSSNTPNSCRSPGARWRNSNKQQDLLTPGSPLPCSPAAATAAADTPAAAAADTPATAAAATPAKAAAKEETSFASIAENSSAAVKGAPLIAADTPATAAATPATAAATAAGKESSLSWGWFGSFMENLAYAAAAHSAAMSGLSIYPALVSPVSPVDDKISSVVSGVQAGLPAAAKSNEWSLRDAISSFFARVDERLEEGGPALYSEIYDFTL